MHFFVAGWFDKGLDWLLREANDEMLSSRSMVLCLPDKFNMHQIVDESRILLEEVRSKEQFLKE